MTPHVLPLAEYLADELDAEQTATVNHHLVTCDQCWTEVHVARLGQEAARRTTEMASDELRRRVFTQFFDDANTGAAHRESSPVGPASSSPSRRPRQLAISVAALLVAAAVFTAGALFGHATPQPPPTAAHSGVASTSTTPAPAPTTSTLAAALSYYRSEMLPGTGIASAPAPDLRRLGLRVAGASSGTLAAQTVTAYAYCDQAGARKIYVFISATPFRAFAPAGGGPDATRTVRGYTVFSATRHPMIVVGRNHQLVKQVAGRLT